LSSIPAQLLLQAVLILINAFFAATEIAVISLSSAKLKRLEEEGDKTAPKLLKLVEEPSGFLSTIQVGITLAGYLGSAFAAENFSGYFVSWVYDGLGFHALPEGVLNALAIVVITIILAYFTLIFGELVPKRIAMQKSFEVAKFACRVVSGISFVMRPVIWFLSKSTNGVLRVLRLKTEAEEEAVTEDEIRMMVDLGGQRGAIDEDEQEWIQNVFEFGDMTVREAMTPRGDVEAFSADASREEVLETIRRTGLSRFPVYEGTVDTIAGVLNTRDFLLSVGSGEEKTVRELMRPAYFVPESIHADHLFREMQQKKVHMAVVVDEYGGTGGIITMEDLLEEIVGNIYDEFDPAESPEIEQLGENLWRVSGGASIGDLSEALGVKLPESESYDTVGGLIFTQLDFIPRDGSQLDLELCGLSLHVEEVREHRIERILIKKQEKPEISEI